LTTPKLPSQPPEYRHENALKWIRLITGLHYFGGAFEPEHMRDLANIAADALAGTRDLPDFDEAQERSQRKAAEWAARLGYNLAGPHDDDDEPDDDDDPLAEDQAEAPRG
jgi:hypothetical protein